MKAKVNYVIKLSKDNEEVRDTWGGALAWLWRNSKKYTLVMTREVWREGNTKEIILVMEPLGEAKGKIRPEEEKTELHPAPFTVVEGLI